MSGTSKEVRDQTREGNSLRDLRDSDVTAGAAVEPGEWESLHTPSPVVRALQELGFTTPTAIQREAIPPAIVEGCDIIGAAETVSPVTSVAYIGYDWIIFCVAGVWEDIGICDPHPPLRSASLCVIQCGREEEAKMEE